MVRQALDLLSHPLPSEGLERHDDAHMERPPLLLEQRLVGHLLGEGVLEGVFDVGGESRLVEELGGLQMDEAQAERLLRRFGNGLEERQGHL
jgi:hypothetical protein